MTKELRIVNGSFTVKKVLNNNVLIASHHKYSEVVLIGKGIGFGKNKMMSLKIKATKKCSF